MVGEENRHNIEIATEVWELYLEGHTQASISRQLGIHKTEVNYIMKYTSASMYFDSMKVRGFYERLLLLEALYKKAQKENSALQKQLEYEKLPWWKKLSSKDTSQ